jgi:hypothetical protein
MGVLELDYPNVEERQPQRINQMLKRIADLEQMLSTYRPLGSRNLLDNGEMMIAQRLTSNGGITASGFFIAGIQQGASLDRWNLGVNALGTWTNARVAGPSGTQFPYANRFTVTTADAAPAAGDYCIPQQAIEGQFLQHLQWGTANAKPLTLSFLVRSNISGTFIAEIYNFGAGVSSSRAYTLVANTWKYVTFVFPGDQTNAITNSNGSGLLVQFWLAAGTNFTGGGSLNQGWSATANTRAVGLTNLAATVNNFWEFTGAQLEVGPTATPYETLAFDLALQRCRRYYETSYLYGTQVGSAAGATGAAFCWIFDNAVPLRAIHSGTHFSVRKRATPTMRIYALDGTIGNCTVYNGTTKRTLTTNSPSDRAVDSGYMNIGAGAVLTEYYNFQWAAESDL